MRQAHIVNRVEAVEKLPHLAADSDLIVLATPVHTIPELMEGLRQAVQATALVTDVGGAKAAVCLAAEQSLGGSRFIGGHPMCGSERGSSRKADPLIFQGQSYLLCPLPGVDQDKLLSLVRLVEDFGAHPFTLDASDHDRLVSLISHLPQILATTLVHTVSRAAHDRGFAMKVAGNGFRDMTRIAASSFGPWDGVLAANGRAIEQALDEFEQALAQVRGLLQQGESGRDALGRLWEDAASLRRGMTDQGFSVVPRKKTEE
ncbi:MAG: prephenate dehydrogenase [Deltaproteobacteria bacterium]|nr:prephenate dehydrogenase [Deltaproteobacteria bacterium]